MSKDWNELSALLPHLDEHSLELLISRVMRLRRDAEMAPDVLQELQATGISRTITSATDVISAAGGIAEIHKMPIELLTTQVGIAKVCREVMLLLLQKNRAYGNSALNPLRVFSRASAVEQIRVRIDDKLSRMRSGRELPDESLRDTVHDLIGYLVLLLIALDEEALPAG